MPVIAALFSLSEIVLFGAVAALLVGAALCAWPWTRHRGRFAVAAFATLAGWTAWNLVLSENNAASLDVDAPVVPLGAAAIAGAVAMVFDLFVL